MWCGKSGVAGGRETRDSNSNENNNKRYRMKKEELDNFQKGAYKSPSVRYCEVNVHTVLCDSYFGNGLEDLEGEGLE